MRNRLSLILNIISFSGFLLMLLITSTVSISNESYRSLFTAPFEYNNFYFFPWAVILATLTIVLINFIRSLQINSKTAYDKSIAKESIIRNSITLALIYAFYVFTFFFDSYALSETLIFFIIAFTVIFVFLTASDVKILKNKEESIEGRLIQLNDLKQKGLISEEEYSAKRKELVDKLAK